MHDSVKGRRHFFCLLGPQPSLTTSNTLSWFLSSSFFFCNNIGLKEFRVALRCIHSAHIYSVLAAWQTLLYIFVKGLLCLVSFREPSSFHGKIPNFTVTMSKLHCFSVSSSFCTYGNDNPCPSFSKNGSVSLQKRLWWKGFTKFINTWDGW